MRDLRGRLAAVASRFFGGVEGKVGFVEKLVPGEGYAVGGESDAEAGADAGVLVTDSKVVVFYGDAKVLADAFSVGGRRIGKNENELFTTETPDEVRIAGEAGEKTGDFVKG